MKISVGGYCINYYDENYQCFGGLSVKQKYVDIDTVSLCLKDENYKFIEFVDYNSDVNFTDDVPFDIIGREFYEGEIMDDDFDINEFKIHYGEVRLNGNRTGQMLIDDFYYKGKKIDLCRVK